MLNWIGSFFYSYETIDDDVSKQIFKKVKKRRNRHIDYKKMNRKLLRSTPDYGAVPKYRATKQERVNGVSRDNMLLELEKRSVVCSDVWSDDLLKQQFLLHCK